MIHRTPTLTTGRIACWLCGLIGLTMMWWILAASTVSGGSPSPFQGPSPRCEPALRPSMPDVTHTPAASGDPRLTPSPVD